MPSRVGLNSERVGRDNLALVLRQVHSVGPQSRSDLVALTGLNRTTIGSLVRQLESRELVREQQVAPSGQPGRPSHVVSVRPDTYVALALEVCVDSLAVAVIGLGGTVLRSRRIPCDSREFGPDDTVALLIQTSNEVTADTDPARIVGVGVAVTGLVRARDGLVRLGPNLGWSDVPLGDLVRAGLGLGPSVTVSVGNEADLGGRIEHLRGAARGHDNMIYLSGEVGLGGGIIVGGRPLVGIGGYAGEVGHIVINPSGIQCACGAVGCWETEVGESALLRAAGIPVSANSRRAVSKVFEGAAAGEPQARAAVDTLGHWLGIGLASLVNTFNPSVIVLGGFFARLAPLVDKVIHEELDRRALRAARERLAILPGRYGIDAPLYGAAELAFEGLLADPTIVAPAAPKPSRRRGASPRTDGAKKTARGGATP